MANHDLINKHFPDDDGDDRPRRGLPRATWLVIAAVFAFGILLYFGYASPRGDNGELPVVTADDSPIKSKPENPGGMDVPHQDATIYNELSGSNQKDAEVEHLLPGAETPMTPPAPTPQENAAAAPTTEAVPSTQSDNAAITEEAPVITPQPMQSAEAPVTLLQPNSAPVIAAPVTAAPVPAAPIPAPAITAKSTAPASLAVPSTSAAKMGSGAVRIQLGSVPSEQVAHSEWQRVSAKNADVLGGLSPNYVKADIPGKGTYFRIQAGPLQEAKATSTCAALKSRAQPCMIVR